MATSSAALSRCGGPSEGGAERGDARPLLVGGRPQLKQRRQQRLTPAPRGEERGRGAAEGDDAEAVAPARGQVAEREGDPLRDVRLPPVCGAERHRGRHVEDEPGDERPLGHVDADVRLAGAGGDVPVDRADVVAGQVRPHLEQLRPVAERGRARLTREQTLDAPPHDHVEGPQEALRDWAWPGPRGGPRRRELREAATHATSIRARSICGTGTEESTASITWSAVTPSASAA